MKLHHLGFAGKKLETMARRFALEGATPLTGAIDDPIQRVTVQFFAAPSGEIWEIIAPLGAIELSPLASRLARGGGLDHVCYELSPEDPGIEECVEIERARGAQIVCAPVMAAAFSRRIAFVFRRSGRLVELVEPRPSGAVL